MTKQHILDEIRRTTNGNGGVPCGVRRFFNETGIKESEWRGVYWARWSDAVREAGFAPNQKTAAYEDNWLLEQFAGFVRELGRFPVQSELRLRARTHDGFPVDGTFDRFGTKPQKIAKLIEFCQGNQVYQDVLAICQAALNSDNAPEVEETEEDGKEEIFGFVYLLKSGRFYKIGRSNAAGRRERELAIQLPEKAAIVHQISTDDPKGIEEYWHRRFDSLRKNGEWFDLSASDVKAFKRRKFM